MHDVSDGMVDDIPLLHPLRDHPLEARPRVVDVIGKRCLPDAQDPGVTKSLRTEVSEGGFLKVEQGHGGGLLQLGWRNKRIRWFRFTRNLGQLLRPR